MDKKDKIVQFVFRQIEKSGMQNRELCESAKITKALLCKWRNNGVCPRVDTLERVLNALGYELAIKKKEAGE